MRRFRWAVVLFIALFALGCLNSASNDTAGDVIDYSSIDEHLERWYEFAKGRNDLVPLLNRNGRQFADQLAVAIREDPEHAMGRGVFYAVVQVGALVPLESGVGQALAVEFGDSAPPVTVDVEERGYFAGDLFIWWEANRDRYAEYPLYERWKGSDFARETVIPHYKRLASENAGFEASPEN